MKTIDLKSSKILIDKGIINQIQSYIKETYADSKVLIITDENVKQIYLDNLAKSFEKANILYDVLCFEAGEQTKSFENIQRICEYCADININRGDVILALGGGVIGDLAGFASAIFLRGVKFIAVPTTLLAQVDSSVGGKTGINIKQGKNLVGSFYKADMVFIDTDTLHTLDDDQFKCGMAEVVKYGFIWDKGLYELLLSLKTKQDVLVHIEDIVHTCCEIKAEVVRADEFDKGLRMLLNFGHTIGHAIENTSGYGKYTHGQAVAIGMAMITKKAEQMKYSDEGTYDKVVALLKQFGLDTQLEKFDEQQIFKSTQKDKKNINKNMNIILLREVGKGYIFKIDPKDMVKFI